MQSKIFNFVSWLIGLFISIKWQLIKNFAIYILQTGNALYILVLYKLVWNFLAVCK